VRRARAEGGGCPYCLVRDLIAAVAKVHHRIGGRTSHGWEEDARCVLEWIDSAKEATSTHAELEALLRAARPHIATSMVTSGREFQENARGLLARIDAALEEA